MWWGLHYVGRGGLVTFAIAAIDVADCNGNGLFDGVVIGSGNRADPLDKGGSPENFMYMIKDRRTAAGSGVDTGLTHVDFGDVTSNCLQNGGTCIVNLTNGWRLELEEPGEKVLATALTITGKTFFTTYMPFSGSGATACSRVERALPATSSHVTASRSTDCS